MDAEHVKGVIAAWVHQYKMRRLWRAWWRVARIIRADAEVYHAEPNCDAADQAFSVAKNSYYWWRAAMKCLASREIGDALERKARMGAEIHYQMRLGRI